MPFAGLDACLIVTGRQYATAYELRSENTACHLVSLVRSEEEAVLFLSGVLSTPLFFAWVRSGKLNETRTAILRSVSLPRLAVRCRGRPGQRLDPPLTQRVLDQQRESAGGQNATELLKENVNLKCVAFTPNGGYAILFGPSGYVADDIPKDAFKKLNDIAQADGMIQWIAFAPTGGWVIFYDKNRYASRGVPDEARQQLRELPARTAR